jgi:hypothetical protein
MQARRAFRCPEAPRFLNKDNGKARFALLLAWLSIPIFIFAALLPQRALAQDPQEQSSEEIVANLYTGRVVIGVAKDGIVVATLENPIEPQTRPPMIVPISDERVAIILGAADWWAPNQHRELARLDKELPDLPAAPGRREGPHLQASSQEGAGSEATDIEEIAGRLHTRLNEIAEQIHGNLNLDDGEPLLQIAIVDYAANYGPEVWLIQYSIEQDPAQGDYWQTRVLQPQYTQLWPPEKGQPHGLIEVSYPQAPSLTSLIQRGDAHLAQSIAATPGMQQVSAAILDGDIQKQPAADVAAFFRTCFSTLILPKARMVEAEVNEKQGVGWFIQPPAETEAAGTEQARPAGAPSLRHPGPGNF